MSASLRSPTRSPDPGEAAPTTPAAGTAPALAVPDAARPAPASRFRHRPLVGALAVALLYFATARISLQVLARSEHVTAVWAPGGVLLAVLMLRRPRSWPPLLAGAAVGATLADLHAGLALASAVPFALARVIEGLAAAVLVRHGLGPAPAGARLRAVIGAVLLAAPPAAALGATLGAAVAWRLGAPYLEAWRLWWLVSGLSMVVLSPALLAFAPNASPRRSLAVPRLAEGVALLLVLGAYAYTIFGERYDVTLAALFPYALLPLLIWAALRFGARGAAAAALLLAALAVTSTTYGLGPFALPGLPLREQVLQLQFFLAAAGLSALYMAAVLDERDRAAQALSVAEARYRGLFEGTYLIGLVVDPHSGALLDANRAAVEFYGYTRERLLDLSLLDVHTLSAEELAQRAHQAATGTLWHFDARHRLANGELRDVEVYTCPIEHHGRTVLYLLIHDVTERQRALEAVRRAQEGEQRTAETLQAIIASSPLGVLAVDERYHLTLWNGAAEQILGWSAGEVLGGPLPSMSPAELEQQRKLLSETLAGRPLNGFELERLRRDGTPILLRAFSARLHGARGEVAGCVAIFEDATERHRIEEALRQAQKLESLATLAGGVAHDFNNLLAVVLGHLSAARHKLPEAFSARTHLDKAIPAVEQAGALAHKMLAYSGRGRFRVERVDLAALLQADRLLYEAAVPRHMRFNLAVSDALPLIEADTDQLRQALMALITNAVEAVGARPGTIDVAVAERTVGPDDEELWRFTSQPLPAGRYVSVTVCDDGCGIDAAVLPRIFDPFYTTKFVGRGLGLAAVLGVVRGHRGGIAVETISGTGAVFELVFPAVVEPQGASAAAAPS